MSDYHLMAYTLSNLYMGKFVIITYLYKNHALFNDLIKTQNISVTILLNLLCFTVIN